MPVPQAWRGALLGGRPPNAAEPPGGSEFGLCVTVDGFFEHGAGTDDRRGLESGVRVSCQ